MIKNQNFDTANNGPLYPQDPAAPFGQQGTLGTGNIDFNELADGYRTSGVVGCTVVNEALDTVGTVDDLIITPHDQSPFAVLSVGGFLGMGSHYVVVPYAALERHEKDLMLRHVTVDSLKAQPEYKYTN